jgi:ssDNA-specific exonuclease RecJ
LKNKRFRKKVKNMKKMILLIIPILLLTGCSNNNGSWEETVECTVQDKWVKRNDDEEKYLVSCDDEVYQITDNILYGKFNSSDIYAKLKIGKKYKLTVTGFRSGFLSSYKNINKFEKLESKENENNEK